jgi:hypothetical protein
MWHWDQGHLPYFQFDALREIAAFAMTHDFKRASRAELLASTGLDFAAPKTHSPWRNYSRALKQCLLVSVVQKKARPTPVAEILSQPGLVTCDEYLHFLARATTEPSPALKGWRPNATFRYPLLFALKYLLAKTAISASPVAAIDEVIGAYKETRFKGTEDQTKFIDAINAGIDYAAIGRTVEQNVRRQARESLLVISQISYLHVDDYKITVSLHQKGPREGNPNAEIRRLASLFRDGSTIIDFDFPHTIIDDVVESGFREGSKVKKTHVVIERNSALRKQFFAARPTPICDVCRLETAKSYPWAEQVLDIHHLLPLSSGTRVEENSTTFDDLVPVCPTCHKATHRFYDNWLARMNHKDFRSRGEALTVYNSMKREFPGLKYA